MSLPFSGPVNSPGTCCEQIPGTFPPDLAPYVRSIFSLQGIVGLDGDRYIDVSSEGNTITIGLDIDAIVPILLADEDLEAILLEGGLVPGTGTVTSVGLSSTSLAVTGTNPVITSGTITVNLTGATASIQALATAANKMIYTTASDVYAVTDLSVFARTILDDANAAAVRTTIGAQTQSADLDTFVTVATWTGSNLDLDGSLTVNDLTALGTTLESLTVENISVTDSVTIGGTLGVTGAVTGASFAGVGTALTALSGANITSGAVPGANGGTGHAGGYTIGDILYASASGTLSKLADVAVGSYLRSGGVATAPLWSTLKLPNAATTGDILYASSANTIGNLADVATGNALISGGVGTAPSWGKITTAHATGLAGSGNNTNITAFTGTNIAFNDGATFNADTTFAFGLIDTASSPGTSGQVLSSTGTEVQWITVALANTTGIAGSGANENITSFTGTNIEFDDGATFFDTTTFDAAAVFSDNITINSTISVEGTITPGGSTGGQVINKPSGTVRVAAAGTTVTVTNSLCSTNSRVMAMCSTNDATAYVANVVTASGSFAINLGAAATAETEISWILFNIT